LQQPIIDCLSTINLPRTQEKVELHVVIEAVQKVPCAQEVTRSRSLDYWSAPSEQAVHEPLRPWRMAIATFEYTNDKENVDMKMVMNLPH